MKKDKTACYQCIFLSPDERACSAKDTSRRLSATEYFTRPAWCPFAAQNTLPTNVPYSL
jgi:hypothetical protein